MVEKGAKIMSITNRTMIPISFVGAIWFGSSWLIGVKNLADTNAKELQEHKSATERIIEKLDRNNERLARIEEKLKHIHGRLRNEQTR